MQMFYDSFFRRNGVRKAEQLMSPPLPLLETLELPKNSIYHYVGDSPLEVGPASDDFLFRNITRPIMVGHIVENGDNRGTPRRMSVAADALVRNYHVKNRRFRMLRTLESSARDINTLVVYNYGALPHLYRYMRSYYTELYRWWNIEAAVWHKIGLVGAESDRQQFILCKLPTVLPSLSDLKMGEGTINQRTLKIFDSPEALMILELWKFLGANRPTSVISKVTDGHLDRVNLIFQESGRWFVLNLGILNKWRIATDTELETNPAANTKGILPAQMQRRFLRLMMALFQVRTVPVDTSAVVVVIAEVPVETEVVVTALPGVVLNNANLEPETMTTAHVASVTQEQHERGPNTRGEDLTHDAAMDALLDADLAGLEVISKKYVEDRAASTDGKETELPKAAVLEPTLVPIKEAVTLKHGVMLVCDRLADQGLLSAAEYRRYDALADTYRRLPSPDGKTTLDKFIQITPEQLLITKSPTIGDIATVVDKSMLKSSLHVFDSRYVREVLPKDVAGMVLNIQNAGISVTNYEVERIEDVLGSYDSHTVRVVPVEGAASTFRFKLPAVSEDGTFQANGTKYRMRKQRGDFNFLIQTNKCIIEKLVPVLQ